MIFSTTHRAKPLSMAKALPLIMSGAFFLTCGIAQADTTYFNLAGGNLTQDWTNPGLITTNDSWSGVPSITGYLGDTNAASPTDVDPRTYTAPTLGAVDVIANQTNPNTQTAGGVAEFQIADPVVALQGSGTADTPGLVFYLNATGRQNISFTCDLRDIDGSADNAPQQIAVQYRVGGAAAFTNIAYVADASTGPSLATLVTPINVTLPADANNQAQVEIRVITTNAAASDEWIGVDNINISSSPAVSAPSAVISEYRPSGAGGASDEYVEIYNASGAALDVSGWTVNAGTASPGTTIFTIPANTTLPVRGHYLIAGTAYSLGTAGNNPTALAADSIPDGGGVALINTSATTVDAVGVSGLIEGTGLPTAPGAGVEYAYVRKVLPGGTGEPSDTGNNATDFFLVSTTSTSGTGSPRLGSPGPENLASPIQGNGSLGYTTVTQARVTTPSANAPAGTLTLRRRITNNTRSTITLIRLRAVEITAGTGGTANTPIISGNGSTAPGVALPQGGTAEPAPFNRFVSMTLEGPSATSGAGVNASLTSGPISLPVGESIDIEYTLNIVTGGTYRVVASFETL